MNGPHKIVVQRAGGDSLPIALRLGNFTKLMTEDTAQVLGRALQMVSFGEKEKLTVYEESSTRPACVFTD